jgi:Tol biopolymer transport system component
MATLKIIFFFLLVLIACGQKKTIIEDTAHYIVFNRQSVEPGSLDYDVWLINSETLKEIQLTKFKGYLENNPVWLSDSELIYFFSEAKPSPEKMIYHNFKSGEINEIKIQKWKSKTIFTNVSCDKEYNIYYDTGTMNNAIIKVYLQHKNPVASELISANDRLAYGLAVILDPIVSPDNTKLLFYACDTVDWRQSQEKGLSVNYNIYYIKNNGSTNVITQLTTDKLYTNVYPNWVDDHQIVFASSRDNNLELYLLNIDNRQIRRLTVTNNANEELTTVSPDKKHIAYTKWFPESNKTEIWIMNLETKETWYLTDGFAPDWSPAQ